jgi:hypothetical protein
MVQAMLNESFSSAAAFMDTLAARRLMLSAEPRRFITVGVFMAFS